MKVTTKILALWAVCLFMFYSSPGSSHAAIINAMSCSYSDVSEAVSSANPGDTVKVPAGICTWTSTLKITKGIVLEGAGSANTIIKLGSGPRRLVLIQPATPENNSMVDISGFTFDTQSVTNSQCMLIKNENSTYYFTNFRIHDNIFKGSATGSSGSTGIYTRGTTYGVIYNNIFENGYVAVDCRGYDYHTWNEYKKAEDNTLVYSSLGMGGPDFLYIEDNKFKLIKGSTLYVKSGEGARWVARYNSADGGVTGTTQGYFDIHGDTSNDGCVAVEIYGNSETTSGDDASFTFADYRGGTAMIYNNTVRVLSSGIRTMIKIREETSPCGKLEHGYDMKVHNGYIWNNRNTYTDPYERIVLDHHLGVADYDPGNCLTEKVDYWADTQDGTKKATTYFKYDVAAKRPSTCSDGDCYWETDAKKLYRCEGANNWVLVYQPYTYPHPLRALASPGNPPMAPRNLKITN